ncbi:MAG: hypothetical protein P1U77_27155 [Rubripirellula sp.]|nr:hypothetical protein [Rubripirellula sp.]
MHERTQRAVARLMFVFCCAVPTAITFGCVIVTWTPWYHANCVRQMERELSDATGLVVQLQDLQRTAPGGWDLHGVELIDPETNREVARVRKIQWASENGEASLLLHQPELESSQLKQTWRLLHDRWLCGPLATQTSLTVAGNDLTIHSRFGSMTLRDVDAWIRPEEKSIEATIRGLPASSHSEVPLQLTVRRDRSGETPSTQWQLASGGTPLPCSALSEYLPLMAGLGSEAMFSGTIAWQQTQNEWSIDLGGSRFENISLDRLFEQHAHRLSGKADLQLDRCRIDPTQRRSDIAGSIRASKGSIGRSLLAAAQQNLAINVDLPEPINQTPGDIPFDRIAIGFNLNNTQLSLSGICRNEPGYESYPAGVVMLLDGLPLARSTDTTLPALSVLTAIAPTHSVPVPVSSQTQALMNIFIPPSRPLPAGEAYPPRIRSARNWSAGPTVVQP